MYDIKPLEKEWEKYNKKKRRPLYIMGLIVFLSVLFTGLVVQYNLLDFVSVMPKKIAKKVIVSKERKILLNAALIKLEVKALENENVHKKIKAETIIIDNDNPMDEDILISSAEQIIKKPKVKKEIFLEKPKKKIHLNIIKTTSVSAYKDVENRFYESHDIDDSLFLAKSYYKRGEYKKSEYWAVETNKINNNIEESWIIFIKSKVKLGNKNEAIRILNSYIKRSNSGKAKNLLYKIKKGKL
jgi:tetratricopeptide (TPR) repeat protein